MSRESAPPDPLLARCQRGDRAAFRELFDRHRADVARLVFRMLGRDPDIEDVVQDVFVQVFRSITDFRGDAKFSTWLHRLTVNVVLMHLRAQRSRPRFTDALSHDVRAASLDPDDDAFRRQRVRAFYAILERLTDKKRTVFVLHELDGMPLTEVAKLLEIPLLTVRTRLFYARRELIQMLRDEPALAALADIMIRAGSADLASSPGKGTP